MNTKQTAKVRGVLLGVALSLLGGCASMPTDEVLGVVDAMTRIYLSSQQAGDSAIASLAVILGGSPVFRQQPPGDVQRRLALRH